MTETKKPRRKQTELPGLEKPIENEAVEEAAQAYCELRDQRSALSKREKQAQMNLIAVMHAEVAAKRLKIPRYTYLDDNGDELEVVIELGAEKAVVRKTGDAESEIGEGVAERDDQGDAGDNVLRQAAASQRAAGVAENDDGDVVPTDASAPKAKRGRPRKAK